MGTQTPSGTEQQGTKTVVRILIADSRSAMRTGLRQGLSALSGIEIAGEAADWQELQGAAGQLKPDVLLVSVALLTGIPHRLPDATIQTPLLAMLSEKRDVWLPVAVDAGALGYVLEEATCTEFATALHRAASKHALWTDEELARAQRWHEDVGRRWRSLTQREQDLLGLLATGMDNAAIANAMAITPKTVENHVYHILDKLALTSRLQAATWFLNEIPASLREGEGNG